MKMAKEKKEKKSKVKKVKEKADKPKGKKGKKGEAPEEEEGGGGGGKKKLIIIGVLLLLILVGGLGSAYFLVYLPMTQNAEGTEEETLEAVVQVGPASPTGYYGYLSYNADATNQLFIDDVYVIKGNETQLVEEWELTEEQMKHGYYISNPVIGNRDIYVSQATIFNIISKETGENEVVTWNDFIDHLSNGTILCEFESFDNILTVVTEFPVNDYVVPDMPAPEIQPEEGATAEEGAPTEEGATTGEETAPVEGEATEDPVFT